MPLARSNTFWRLTLQQFGVAVSTLTNRRNRNKLFAAKILRKLP
jgi:hypothetical protein